MRPSHACQQCGQNLGGIPAPDPHYGLRVVTCRSCGLSVVRQRGSLLPPEAKLLGRIDLALGIFVVQVALLISSISTMAAAGIVIGRSWMPDADMPLRRPEILVLMSLGIPVGAWLATGLRHWPRTVPWIVVMAGAFLVLAVTPIIGPCLVRLFVTVTGERPPDGATEFETLLLGRRTLALGGLGVATLAGRPLGPWVLLASRLMRRKWLRMRVRARRRVFR